GPAFLPRHRRCSNAWWSRLLLPNPVSCLHADAEHDILSILNDKSIYMTAEQAAEALGVSRATLYAYTSRGQVRSEPVAGRTHKRRYLRADIEALQQRKEARRDPGKAAERGLHWGSPVLDSELTLIQDGRLYYRGQDALKLAERASLEEIA